MAVLIAPEDISASTSTITRTFGLGIITPPNQVPGLVTRTVFLISPAPEQAAGSGSSQAHGHA